MYICHTKYSNCRKYVKSPFSIILTCVGFIRNMLSGVADAIDGPMPFEFNALRAPSKNSADETENVFGDAFIVALSQSSRCFC